MRAKLAANATNVFVSSPISAPEPYEAREILTFAQVYDAAVRLGALLVDNGAGVGSRVAIGGTNCTGWVGRAARSRSSELTLADSWVVAFVAIHLIGAVPVLLNNGL